ncbi:hypothetical protein ACSMXN_19995 [Jatrophihabitans sp. DSM 45814]
MIVSAASVPNPPMLFPGMTGGLVAEVEELRHACLTAISRMLAAGPELVVIVGAARPGEFGNPLSVTVGQTLLNTAGCALVVEPIIIPIAAGSSDCNSAGRGIASRPERIGLLVMADGSARRGLKAPGYLDERAAGFDSALTGALELCDWASVAATDLQLAEDLLAAGVQAWQVMAGALAETSATSGNQPAVASHYQNDPFGVWYPVLSYQFS